MTIAANKQSFIDRDNAFHMFDSTETLNASVTDIFKPCDDASLMHSRGLINFHPKRSTDFFCVAEELGIGIEAISEKIRLQYIASCPVFLG